MSEHFDIHRVLRLIQGDLIQRYRSTLIFSAALAIFLFLYMIFIIPDSADVPPAYRTLLTLLMFIWGPIAASSSFRELGDKTRNEAWLLLPASAFEKMLTRLMLVVIMFPLYAIIFVTLLAWIITSTRALVFGQSGPLFAPLEGFDYHLFVLFIVNQSLFFLGAAWFRRSHFIKTALTLFLGGFALSIIGMLLIWPIKEVLFVVLFGVEVGPHGVELTEFEWPGWLGVVHHLLVVVLTLFCWYVTWLRIRESQVSHGI